MKRILLYLVLVLLLLGVVGCSRCSSGGERVAEIVFIDQAVICPLVKKTIDSTWVELGNAVGDRDIMVKRIHKDRSGNVARKYMKIKATGLLPAIYFFDGNGELVEFLAGEQSSDAIVAVLDSR
ncbi:MAG: hypothetical protein FWD57_09000 [Polyangiaceae bacterium]|nr:hypothetical protein [Polyangiaceae bacterium]